MKRMLLTTAIAGLLLAGSPAFAAPSPDQHRGDRHGWQHRDHDYDRGKHHKHKHKHWKRNGHDNGLHKGWYKQQWRRGDRLSRVYLQPRYYVDDYRAYRLSAPPRGYRWVRPYQNSEEFLLVQVATGLITQILGY